MQSVVKLLPALILLGVPGAVDAENYLPLDLGNSWGYEAENLAETRTVTGDLEIFDRQFTVISYSPSSSNEGLTNFWTSDDAGNVHVGGFYLTGDFGFAYDPPIQVVKGPLSVGASWSQTVAVFSYPDLVAQGSLDIAYEVFEEGVLTVPYGEFFAFGIGRTDPGSFLDGYSLVGERRDDSEGGSAWDWWTDGLGQPQYRADGLYQLVITDVPTPIELRTWGSIKHQFGTLDR